MKKNLGRTDRTIRAAVAVLVGILYLTGAIRGTLAIVLGIFALAMLATSATGFCSLYVPFGFSTLRKCPKEE